MAETLWKLLPKPVAFSLRGRWSSKCAVRPTPNKTGCMVKIGRSLVPIMIPTQLQCKRMLQTKMKFFRTSTCTGIRLATCHTPYAIRHTSFRGTCTVLVGVLEYELLYMLNWSSPSYGVYGFPVCRTYAYDIWQMRKCMVDFCLSGDKICCI